MKFNLFILAAACLISIFLACSDDDPAGPSKSGSAAFNTSKMPVNLPNNPGGGYGNMALDELGNLLVPSQNGVRYRINKSSCTLEIAAANVGIAYGGPYDLMCCAYDPARDKIYVGAMPGNPSRIFSVDPDDGSSQLLVGLGNQGQICQLLIAPAGFGVYGGFLLVFTNSGLGTHMIAIDPDNLTRPFRQERAAISLPAGNVQYPSILCKSSRETIAVIMFQCKEWIGLLRYESLSRKIMLAFSGIFIVRFQHLLIPFLDPLTRLRKIDSLFERQLGLKIEPGVPRYLHLSDILAPASAAES